MRTSKPIATISYNSKEYLEHKLNELFKAHTISDWFFIHHTAEADEKKDHFHVWIKPNKLIDTMDLQDFFKEPNEEEPHKPFGCIDFVNSSTDDAVLYFVHDPNYLISKNQSREFVYKRDDFVVCNEDSFEYLWQHAYKASEWAKNSHIRDLLEYSNFTPYELFMAGAIPLKQATFVNSLMNLKKYNYKVERNGNETHE